MPSVNKRRVLTMPLPPVSASEAEDARILEALRTKGLDAAREAREKSGHHSTVVAALFRNGVHWLPKTPRSEAALRGET